MLRSIVLALLLVNLGYWAWSAGALSALGFPPAAVRDPSRVDRQLRPEAVRVLPADATLPTTRPQSPAPAAPPAEPLPAAVAATPAALAESATFCLETQALTLAAADAAEPAVAALLPAGAWERQPQPAEHVVAIGPLGGNDAVRKKVEELGRLRLAHESVKLPGDRDASHLVLGRYDSQSAAQAALLAFSQKGVRTARVVLAREAGSSALLRVAAATSAQADALRAMRNVALGDAGFSPCAPR
jgi:hypothetical protein